MQQQNSFVCNERPQIGLDIEFGSDPASGAFFQVDGRKHDDLKQMLDSNKDTLKLEAMKRIISMVARGRDTSNLFPAVVKNVVSKNIEVKKLVYVYLVRYAEEQQDLALLSISAFQRALKDPNQLIRASALRVLSSIRVNMIVPIVMLAIHDSASDMSPYVRKTAAHAIPKLYSLDPDLKSELVIVIEKLLSDRTTLVVGSAVMAFDEVCPERTDLIHKNYRKLCNLLIDIDEWGQVIIINLLTRYIRSQFMNSNFGYERKLNVKDINAEQPYDDSSSSSIDCSMDLKMNSNDKEEKLMPIMDLDYRLLLRQTKPLLQSRNASVVMAVAQLYHHVAPNNEVDIIVKALLRLLRSHKEVQSVVLTCIASMSIKRKSIFEPYTKSFFVLTSDPTHIKLIKLEILTNLASLSSISLILREFQTYISSSDRSFVAATIQAIGRCAATIREITDVCLGGLVHLLSNRNELVVAESVVVIKRLVQIKAAEHYKIISQMARLLDFIKVSAARASIIWLVGEYNEKVPKIAPDVFRKMAKSFVDEDDIVKLQILNMGVKLCLSNAEQTSLICQYVFTLARYDLNYDVRDRARCLRQFVFPSKEVCRNFSQKVEKIFLSDKPTPALQSKYSERDYFQLGSLSHYLNIRVAGYTDLPLFHDISNTPLGNMNFYLREKTGGSGELSDGLIPKSSGEEKKYDSASEKSCDHSNFFSSSEDLSYSSSSSESETAKSELKFRLNKSEKSSFTGPDNSNSSTNSGTYERESKCSESSSKCSGSESDVNNKKDSRGEFKKHFQLESDKIFNADKVSDITQKFTRDKSNDMDLLMTLDDIPNSGVVLKPHPTGSVKKNNSTIQQNLIAKIVEPIGPSFIELEYVELLNKLLGNGLHISYRFTRLPNLYSSELVSVELLFINQSQDEINNIHIKNKNMPSRLNLNDFSEIQSLHPREKATRILGFDFNDSTHKVEFYIISSLGKTQAALSPPIGELVRSVKTTEIYFREERSKLRGMNENESTLKLIDDLKDTFILKQEIFRIMNVANIPTEQSNVLYFIGQTLFTKCLVLITVDFSNKRNLLLTVNCEKVVIGSMILNELHTKLNSHLN